MHHAFGLGSRFYTTYLLSMSEANGISVRLKLCSGPKIPATDKFVRWAMSNTSMPSERSIPKSFTQEYVSQLGTTVYRSLSGGGSTSVMGCSDTLHTVSLSASRVIGLFYTVVFLLCDETIARAKLRSAVFRALSCSFVLLKSFTELTFSFTNFTWPCSAIVHPCSVHQRRSPKMYRVASLPRCSQFVLSPHFRW